MGQQNAFYFPVGPGGGGGGGSFQSPDLAVEWGRGGGGERGGGPPENRGNQHPIKFNIDDIKWNCEQSFSHFKFHNTIHCTVCVM